MRGHRRLARLTSDSRDFILLIERCQSGRYNVGVIDGIEFPSLSYESESTPEDEVVDDAEESVLREKVFNIKDIPPPDFTIDDDAIFLKNPHAHVQDSVKPLPRPKNVGIIGLEVYFPKRVSFLSFPLRHCHLKC